ncbi:B12-binding domain-containing radical SAM protein [Pelodictyon phaeoclathratiforme]|uniref:Radical SAM domain protein n=1 Tax=Pelodictyon phaeoclathratiforme (strain DSM 5477 / BU-1) TaxID=324925 RepID=B4SBT0_PELPB|nr:B12-binding domain-containing radical SAM protein [Pelodictyon phaeoclathratiforme]ACF42605.1 Radical SAM domain protein [Pelodictyon phaeoclathratiforme BU-1]MBV5327663.1 B12-binding domain-containing radical SAM protein [Chlorobium sp.]
MLSGDLRGYFGAKVSVVVQRVDRDRDISSCIKEIQNHKPDIIGFSIGLGSLELAESLYKQCSDIQLCGDQAPKLVLGNKIPSYYPKDCIDRFPKAAVVVGEGELALRDLVEVVRGNILIKKVSNLVYKLDNGVLEQNKSEEAPDLKDLDYPPSVDTVPEIVKRGGNALVQASRGCPWSQCAYCTIFSFRGGKRWESFSNERIIANIELLVAQGITEIEFADDEFLGGRTSVRIRRCNILVEAFRKIRERVKDFSFRIFLEPSTIYRSNDISGNEDIRKLLQELKSVGLERVYIGVESGSNKQLERYKRDGRLDVIKGAIKVLTDIGIDMDAGFIMFDTFATLEELQDNIVLFRSLPKGSNTWPFRPLAINEGSDYLKDCIKWNVKLTKNLSYMSYTCDYFDPSVRLIAQTIDAVSLHTRTLFYALKRGSTMYYSDKKRTDSIRFCQEYVNRNSDIYIDLLEELVFSAQKGILDTANLIIEAEEKLKKLVAEVKKSVKDVLIDDPDYFLHDEITRIESLHVLIDVPPVATFSASSLRRIVIVDLDHTLFDSTAVRRKCAEQAIKELGLSEKIENEALDLYCRCIYDNYADYELNKFPDFRVVWNTAESYRVLLALIELGIHPQNYQKESESQGFYLRLRGMIDDIYQQYSSKIKKAQDIFWKTPMVLYDYAIEFLDNLKNDSQYNLILASEGDNICQGSKIKYLGLDKYFDSDHVKITGKALAATSLKVMAERAYKEIQKKIYISRKSMFELNITNTENDNLKNEIIAKVKWYYKILEVIDWIVLYALSVYTKNRIVDRLSVLEIANSQIEMPGDKVQVLMIGDRWSDMEPYTHLCRQLHTVQIRQGPYMNETIGKADYCAINLQEIGVYLSKSDTWVKILPMDIENLPEKGMIDMDKNISRELKTLSRTKNLKAVRSLAGEICRMLNIK